MNVNFPLNAIYQTSRLVNQRLSKFVQKNKWGPEFSLHQLSDPLVNSRNAERPMTVPNTSSSGIPHRDELQDEDVHPRTANLIECHAGPGLRFLLWANPLVFCLVRA
jgi:hypothetical protein